MITNQFDYNLPIDYSNKKLITKEKLTEYETVDIVAHLLKEMESVKKQLNIAQSSSRNLTSFEKGWECAENDIWDSI